MRARSIIVQTTRPGLPAKPHYGGQHELTGGRQILSFLAAQLSSAQPRGSANRKGHEVLCGLAIDPCDSGAGDASAQLDTRAHSPIRAGRWRSSICRRLGHWIRLISRYLAPLQSQHPGLDGLAPPPSARVQLRPGLVIRSPRPVQPVGAATLS